MILIFKNEEIKMDTRERMQNGYLYDPADSDIVEEQQECL